MSPREVIIRLESVEPDKLYLTGRQTVWNFRILHLQTRARVTLVHRLVETVNETYLPQETSLFGETFYSKPIAREDDWDIVQNGAVGAEGFSLCLENVPAIRAAAGFASARSNFLEEFTTAALALTQSMGLTVRVQMLRALDGLLPGHFSKCGLLENFDPEFWEQHLSEVRATWENYLAFLLADSPVRNGITQPEVISEILLEYPDLDLKILLDLLAGARRTAPIYLSSFVRSQSDEKIIMALNRLAAHGFLQNPKFDRPATDKLALSFEVSASLKNLMKYNFPTL